MYIKFLKRVLSDKVLKADTISDTDQIVIFSNLTLLNLCTYFFKNYGVDKLITDADIQEAIFQGNKIADDSLPFRTNFFKWMGSQEYAELLNSITLGCAVNTTADMKNDYIIKIACLAYGLQLLFADSDLQEVSNYMNASWFSAFISMLSKHVTKVTEDCDARVGAAYKGLRVLAKVAKAAGKGLIYAAPAVGKAAWYTGKATWYTSKTAIHLAGKIPGAKTAGNFTLALLQIIGDTRYEMAVNGVL